MGWLARLRQLSEIRKVRPEVERDDVRGGREAELVLERLVGDSFAFRDAVLLTGRRVPSAWQDRRREIDLIVCTPRMVHLIEVKNWSGRLSAVGDRWRQTRRNGEVVDHPDVAASNRQKHDAVMEYLADAGLALDDTFARAQLVTKIIFLNPNLELDPAIEARPEVLSRRALDAALARQPRKGTAERVFASVIDYCRQSEFEIAALLRRHDPGLIPPTNYKRIVTLLTELGTWDRLRLYGGRVVTGDLIDLKTGAGVLRRPVLADRARGRPIRLSWTRGRFWGTVKALTGLGALGTVRLGRERIAVDPDDSVLFHEVGAAEPSLRPLMTLDQVILG